MENRTGSVVQFSSDAQLCLTLCNPMDCSMPGFLSIINSQTLLKSCPLSQWYHSTISSSVIPFSLCLQSFRASGSFLMSQFFPSGGQSIGASALASVLPMSIQGWFPLRSTGLIPLLSRSWRHQFFASLPSLGFSSHNCTWPLGRPLPWLYSPLLAEWCLCFSTHCVGLPLSSVILEPKKRKSVTV